MLGCGDGVNDMLGLLVNVIVIVLDTLGVYLDVADNTAV
jgi:hypothetical protein